MFTLDDLRKKKKATYSFEDIERYAKQFSEEGITIGIPADFDQFLKDIKPRNDDEVALWIYVCLTRNGLTGQFTRHANPRQPEHSSHIDFIADAFFERVSDCIVLGSRKAAKTLTFATLLLMEALFKPGIELAHLGAIQDQAVRCYRYFLKMLNHPLFAGITARPPTAVRTEFKNGSIVEILTGTVTGVNCLHGDTLIECGRDVELYPDGIPIKELVDKTVVVPTIHEVTGEVQYRQAKGLYSGKARCVKVTVKSKDVTGQDKVDEIICTPEHRFLMLESHKYKKARSLRPGDRLVPFDPPYTRDVAGTDEDSRFTKERRILLPQSWEKRDVVFRAEHREIAKAFFGREAVTTEVVIHHTDGRRLNNDPSNLEVLDALTHHKLHFGEDSQGYITPESLKKMSKSRTRYGVDPLWQDKEWLKSQIIQGKSSRKIAQELNVVRQTIEKWVQKHDLEVVYQRNVMPERPVRGARGSYKKRDATEFPWQDASWLQTEVSTKELKQIGEETGCTVSTLKHWCTKLGVALPVSKFNRFVKQEYDNPEVLRKDLEQGLTLKQMGEKYDLSEAALSRKIQKMDLRNARPVKDVVYQNKEWLQEQVDKGLSQQQMAELAGCAQTQIGVHMRRLGIKKSQADPVPLYHDEAYLKEQLEQGISVSQIARDIGCSLCAVQKGIKRLGLQPMVEARTAAKLYTQRDWLIEQLRQGRTVTEIAREQGCSQGAVSLQMKKFGFTAKQVRDNPEAYYENHVVVSVEWVDGEHDVYDLSIIEEAGDDGYRHNFALPCGVWPSNSPHPVKAQLDEVELMDWHILQEALNMAASMKGYVASTRLTSTRKYSTGTMQKIIDEAETKGFRIYRWNLWDVIEPCRIPKGLESVEIILTDEDDHEQYHYVAEECTRCSLLEACQGRARYSEGGIIPLQDAIKTHKSLDKAVWDAQVECKKPGTSDLWFPMFNESHHVIDYEAWLKARGQHVARDYETDGMVVFNPDLPVYAGQDAGYNCPAAVFAQLVDEETVIIFDEIYEHNIAPSVLVKEHLLVKESEYLTEQWFCDPSGLQLMAEMELSGLMVAKADNAVYPGIELIQSLFATGRLFIDKRCVNLIQELKHYRKTKMGKVALNQEDHCLIGETPVNTTEGTYPIRDLVGKTGLVYCWDEQQQCLTTAPFFDVHCTQQNVEVLRVELEDGRVITGTPQHPVLTQDGWKLLGDLTEEDCIFDGFTLLFIKVASVRKAPKADVYNMEVAQHHNFCVADGLVVHNCVDSLRYLLMSLGLFSGMLEAVTTGVGRAGK